MQVVFGVINRHWGNGKFTHICSFRKTFMWKLTVRHRRRREYRTKIYFGGTEYEDMKWNELAQKRFKWRNELSGTIKTGNISHLSNYLLCKEEDTQNIGEIWVSLSRVAVDLGLVGCHAVSLGARLFSSEPCWRMLGWVFMKLLSFLMLELVKTDASIGLSGCNWWIIYTIVVDIIMSASVTQDGKRMYLADSRLSIAAVRTKRPWPV